jgi:hypothetical protein
MASFSTRRGRPRVERPPTDFGTPELIAHRARGETIESLDLCLERRIINPREHWCGIHLRWLHTIRCGAPGISALSLHEHGRRNHAEQDLAWQQEREAEYRTAVDLLKSTQSLNAVISICVDNHRPPFLKSTTAMPHSSKSENEFWKFKCGLQALDNLWHP